MKYMALFFLSIILLFHLSCELDGSDLGLDHISEEDANAQNFNLITPGYEMQVAISDDVDGDTQDILDVLDERAADFLECQFMMGPDIGAEPFQIESGEIVPPLSELRVYVVPFNFECDAEDKDICAGIYFFDSDLIVIAVEGLGRCGQLPLWKHELGHRYGMTANHSNQSEFEPCIDPPECAFDDFEDVGIAG
ncbi:MAG TPA: hypothetical protein VNN20_05295 [Thermodesulfobacteriota bacterium]|nr:hypothetical protein [Thermodesulfobacteriota bacterium]